MLKERCSRDRKEKKEEGRKDAAVIEKKKC